MYCSQCGKEISESDRFCAFCGTAVKHGHTHANTSQLLWVNDSFFGIDYSLLGMTYEQLNKTLGSTLPPSQEYKVNNKYDSFTTIELNGNTYFFLFKHNNLIAVRYDVTYELSKHNATIKTYSTKFNHYAQNRKTDNTFKRGNLFEGNTENSGRLWDLNCFGNAAYVSVFVSETNNRKQTTIQYQTLIDDTWELMGFTLPNEIILTDCIFSYRKKVSVTIDKKRGRIGIVKEDGCFELKDNYLSIYRKPMGIPAVFGGVMGKCLVDKSKIELITRLSLKDIKKSNVYSATEESVIVIDLVNGNQLALVSSHDNIKQIQDWANTIKDVISGLFK